MQRIAIFLLFFATTARAATEYPASFHWRTITTQHFYIHYHQGEEGLAQRAAVYAENAHTRVAPMIGWEPSERTNIILADHVDASNGSATPFPSNRIEIYVTAPGADPSSPIETYDNWLNLVITHEYTHILHLDQARGFGRAMRMVFGRNPILSFPEIFSPLWFIEGLATLSESENTNAGRLKGTYVDMVLRTAAIENRWATEAQASGLSPYWPIGNARYYYGSKFLQWLVTSHGGEAKLRDYIADYSANVIPFRVNASAEDVYSVSMKELWNRWSVQQQRAYRRDRERLAADTFSNRSRLTNLGYETAHTIVSPDGTRVAYAHQGPFQRATIRVMDVATNRDVVVHSVNSTSPLSWSADGRSIAYSDLEFVGSFRLYSDLYVWDVGGRTRRITNGARLRDPAFTPDGRSLIAIENGAGRNRIVEVDVATGAVKPIVTPEDERQWDDPAVSHDGSRIAVAEWQNGNVNIVVYDRHGALIANLTKSMTGATNASPRFSSDDRTVYFSSDFTGVPNLYSVDVNGGDAKRITNVYGGALYPSSNDGKRFYYTDYSADGFDVAATDVTQSFATTSRVVAPATVELPRAEARGYTESKPYSPWQSLRPRWWFPILSSTTINGKSRPIFGLTTTGGDVIGHHSYTATLTNRLYGLLYSYDRLYPTFTVAASQFQDNFIGATTGNEYTAVTNRIFGLVSVPFRKVQWQTSFYGGVIRDHVGGDVPPSIFTGTLQGIRAGAFFNNAHEYLFSISPERGITANLDYENLNRSLGSDLSAQTLRGDVRGYLTIPYKRSALGHHVLALRAAGGRNMGDFIFQRQLRVGGDSTGELTTADIRNFPVRGFDEGTLRGRTAEIVSAEYRFPLYEIDRGPSTYPLFFNRVHGDVFTDAGRASGQHIASAGAEGAVDFIIANALLIRARVGVAVRLTDPDKSKVVPYLSIGSSF